MYTMSNTEFLTNLVQESHISKSIYTDYLVDRFSGKMMDILYKIRHQKMVKSFNVMINEMKNIGHLGIIIDYSPDQVTTSYKILNYIKYLRKIEVMMRTPGQVIILTNNYRSSIENYYLRRGIILNNNNGIYITPQQLFPTIGEERFNITQLRIMTDVDFDQ